MDRGHDKSCPAMVNYNLFSLIPGPAVHHSIQLQLQLCLHDTTSEAHLISFADQERKG